jgi:hypothetical protein
MEGTAPHARCPTSWIYFSRSVILGNHYPLMMASSMLKTRREIQVESFSLYLELQ